MTAFRANLSGMSKVAMTLLWSLASMVWLSGDGEHESPVRVFEGGWQSTEALVADANLRDQVDDLAKKEEIDAEATGIGGDRSDIWLQYQRVLEASSKPDRLALLHHRSPIVRGYLAEDIIEEMPDEFDKVYPLLHDRTPVLTRSGCTGGHMTIAEHVLETIIAAVRDEPHGLDSAVLARIAEDNALAVPMRADALRWLAYVKGPSASAVAHRAMDAEPGSYRETGRLALGQLGDEADVDRIASGAISTAPDIRANTAVALGLMPSSKAGDKLRPLLRDPDEGVRGAALRGLIGNDPELVLDHLGADLMEGRASLDEYDLKQLFEGVKSARGVERVRTLEHSKDMEVRRAAMNRLEK
jgi:hypothetical protein